MLKSQTELTVMFQVTYFQCIPKFPEQDVASNKIAVAEHIDTLLDESKTALGDIGSFGRLTSIIFNEELLQLQRERLML
jgi:hypothetical protein